MRARLWPAALPQCESRHADFGTDGAIEMDLKKPKALTSLCLRSFPLHRSPAERDRAYSVHPKPQALQIESPFS